MRVEKGRVCNSRKNARRVDAAGESKPGGAGDGDEDPLARVCRLQARYVVVTVNMADEFALALRVGDVGNGHDRSNLEVGGEPFELGNTPDRYGRAGKHRYHLEVVRERADDVSRGDRNIVIFDEGSTAELVVYPVPEGLEYVSLGPLDEVDESFWRMTVRQTNVDDGVSGELAHLTKPRRVLACVVDVTQSKFADGLQTGVQRPRERFRDATIWRAWLQRGMILGLQRPPENGEPCIVIEEARRTWDPAQVRPAWIPELRASRVLVWAERPVGIQFEHDVVGSEAVHAWEGVDFVLVGRQDAEPIVGRPSHSSGIPIFDFFNI